MNHSFLKSALRSRIFRGPLPWLGAAVALPGIFFLSQLLCSWVGRGALQALHIWPTTKTLWKYLKYPEAGTLCALNHLSYTEPSNSVFFNHWPSWFCHRILSFSKFPFSRVQYLRMIIRKIEKGAERVTLRVTCCLHLQLQVAYA